MGLGRKFPSPEKVSYVCVTVPPDEVYQVVAAHQDFVRFNFGYCGLPERLSQGNLLP
jgi:hypothetical protein